MSCQVTEGAGAGSSEDKPFGVPKTDEARLRRSSLGLGWFPKIGERRRKWEVVLRTDSFAATDRTLICSEHFKTEDFDRTGQTVQFKDGVLPSIFSFPAHLQRSVAIRSTTTSRIVEDNLPMDLIPDVVVRWLE
ncbi:hypothetical protein AALO_G00201340 [Alosa alosa]|uniref:THAP-type domain-containing protein n=1 Tax=Alosa alosa TaxID=278164 RepID=A0AAV6G424_9TELE|nr:hypothetical protein AALO_G00201340 [Alosa alosa]